MGSPPAAGSEAAGVAGSADVPVGLLSPDDDVAEADAEGSAAAPVDVALGDPEALEADSVEVGADVMAELAAEDVPEGVALLPGAEIVVVWEMLIRVETEVPVGCGEPAAMTLANAAASSGVSCVVNFVDIITVSFTVVAGSRFSCKS